MGGGCCRCCDGLEEGCGYLSRTTLLLLTIAAVRLLVGVVVNQHQAHQARLS